MSPPTAPREDVRSADALAQWLLPRPRAWRANPGAFTVPAVVHVARPPELAVAEMAALRALEDDFRTRLEADLRIDPPGDRAEILLRIDPAGDGAGDRERYRLAVTEDGVEVAAPDHAGLLNGLRTIRQILSACGRTWPGLEIEDEPSFAVRGVSYDVSRGRVPTLAYLKTLVDRLAWLKLNHLQLYVEHTFAFQFDPQIGAGFDPLTADDIHRLDAYCTRRRVALVPALACCGHMGRILSMPEYAHLAEVPSEQDWAAMTWRQRVRGLTLDVTNPESRRLLATMLEEYLPQFSAPQVNVCCDETFDLGKGRGKARADEVGIGGLFVEHVHWLREECGRWGKQLMIWGDMLLKHPETLAQLPTDVTVLNWGYVKEADYDSTAVFCERGLRTYVCPGASGWNRLVNDIETVDVNVRGHVAAGRKHGAVGVLNTEWGDDGHVAPPGACWYPLALGAALSWNADAPAAGDFDETFGRLYFGEGGPAAVAAWRAALRASELVRLWPAFYEPLDAAAPEGWDRAALARWEAAANAAADAWEATAPASVSGQADRDDLVLAFRLHALAGRRFGLARRLADAGGAVDAVLQADLARCADDLTAIIPAYEQAWRARSRPAGLGEVCAVFRRLADEARRLAAPGSV